MASFIVAGRRIWASCVGIVLFGYVAGVPCLADDVETMSQRIDELLDAKLSELGWRAASPASDAEFLRRVQLDLTGTPPTASQVLEFIENEDEAKDAKLIERLLTSPLAASHLGDQWAEWMLPENDGNPFIQADRGLHNWLRDRFSENLRYDRLVSDLLVANGPAQAGPAGFFVALEGKPEKLAAKTARVFMGIQLDCAECHDHPFDEWSQKDFWGFAAYFAQVSTGGNPAMMRASSITDTDEGDVVLPGTDEVIPPKPLVETGLSGFDSGTRRQNMTLWLTAKENPFLARATVNRVWALLFGQGLIEPIDDMRSLEMASHPKLLAELSEYFADSGYDLRQLIQTIARTKAYRRSSTHPSGQPPEFSYAAMLAKPLSERQMRNTVRVVARQIAGDNQQAADVLVQQLGRLRGAGSEAKLGIVSALVMLHGDVFDQVSRENSSRLLMALDAPYMDERKQVRWMFLSTLNRVPTQAEDAAFSDLFASFERSQSADDDARDDSDEGETRAKQMQATWQSDLLWALMNSTEFAMTP
ncbi:MAG: DUF1549 domain-containing protein [Aureliella sp.]